MICFTSSLIRQLYHFATDFSCVLLHLVCTDIENSLFKYRVSYRHLTFKIETFELLLKSCENLICYSCKFNVQLHVHLKKWTSKFKLLYLRNYLSYFDKIRRISCVNTLIESLKVWLKSILPWLMYNIFSRGLFFLLAHPNKRGDATEEVKMTEAEGERKEVDMHVLANLSSHRNGIMANLRCVPDHF